MKIVSIVARILLGLIFTASGIFGLFVLDDPPPMPGLAGAFQVVLFKSHYVWFVDGVQLVCGLSLLSNQYVPLALVALAAIIANILAFHVAMMPAGLAPALVVSVLWLLVALPLRAHFAPLFARTARPA